MEKDQPEDNPQDNQSSSLACLAPNHQQGDQVSKDSIGIQNRKRNKEDLPDKELEVRKSYISSRFQEKKIDTESPWDGVYLYKPGVQLPSLYHFANQSIKIIVAAEYIRQHNQEVLRRNIYGTDPYTSNSDAVCILMHSGLLNINTFTSKRYEGVQLTCKVIKPKKNYSGIFKNGLISRSVKGYNGNALKPESVRNLVTLGPMQLLQRYAANMHIPIGKKRVKSKPKNISIMVPIPETHIVFNMNNQPAYKYSIFNIADKGFQKNQFLIKKLDSHVLYLESATRQKYQLVKSNYIVKIEIQMDVFDVFQISQIRNPDRIDNEYFTREKCPLSDEEIDVIYQNLQWQDILWGNSTVTFKEQHKITQIISFKFYDRQKIDQK